MLGIHHRSVLASIISGAKAKARESASSAQIPIPRLIEHVAKVAAIDQDELRGPVATARPPYAQSSGVTFLGRRGWPPRRAIQPRGLAARPAIRKAGSRARPRPEASLLDRTSFPATSKSDGASPAPRALLELRSSGRGLGRYGQGNTITVTSPRPRTSSPIPPARSVRRSARSTRSPARLTCRTSC